MMQIFTDREDLGDFTLSSGHSDAREYNQSAQYGPNSKNFGG